MYNYAKFLINELELKNGCEAVEMVFLFLIACFYNKMSHTHWTFVMRNHKFTVFSVVFIFKKQVTMLYHLLVRKDFCHILFDSWALRHHLQVTSFVNDTSAHYREKNKTNRFFWVPIESITRNETLISSILIKNVLPRTI